MSSKVDITLRQLDPLHVIFFHNSTTSFDTLMDHQCTSIVIDKLQLNNGMDSLYI